MNPYLNVIIGGFLLLGGATGKAWAHGSHGGAEGAAEAFHKLMDDGVHFKLQPRSADASTSYVVLSNGEKMQLDDPFWNAVSSLVDNLELQFKDATNNLTFFAKLRAILSRLTSKDNIVELVGLSVDVGIARGVPIAVLLGLVETIEHLAIPAPLLCGGILATCITLHNYLAEIWHGVLHPHPNGLAVWPRTAQAFAINQRRWQLWRSMGAVVDESPALRVSGRFAFRSFFRKRLQMDPISEVILNSPFWSSLNGATNSAHACSDDGCQGHSNPFSFFEGPTSPVGGNAKTWKVESFNDAEDFTPYYAPLDGDLSLAVRMAKAQTQMDYLTLQLKLARAAIEELYPLEISRQMAFRPGLARMEKTLLVYGRVLRQFAAGDNGVNGVNVGSSTTNIESLKTIDFFIATYFDYLKDVSRALRGESVSDLWERPLRIRRVLREHVKSCDEDLAGESTTE